MEKKNNIDSVGIYIEGSSSVELIDNDIRGFKHGIVAKDTTELVVRGNKISVNINNDDLDEVLQALKVVEKEIEELRNSKDPSKISKITSFLGASAQALLVEYIKNKTFGS